MTSVPRITENDAAAWPATDAGGAPVQFDEAYQELQRTIERLEEGGLSLEEAIRLYERGMQLAQRCDAIVDAAELRVQRLAPEQGVSDLAF